MQKKNGDKSRSLEGNRGEMAVVIESETQGNNGGLGLAMVVGREEVDSAMTPRRGRGQCSAVWFQRDVEVVGSEAVMARWKIGLFLVVVVLAIEKQMVVRQGAWNKCG